jgi:hypothetical protein
MWGLEINGTEKDEKTESGRQRKLRVKSQETDERKISRKKKNFSPCLEEEEEEEEEGKGTGSNIKKRLLELPGLPALRRFENLISLSVVRGCGVGVGAWGKSDTNIE